ncbi:RICIN domain-containing protein [Streptomyces sp. NPDC057099]|uniref:RICIN domain-containing protein n=1 Tax=Streptomyces sp. NPDC057099 TaxID=3346019 RepID=UPI00363CDF14
MARNKHKATRMAAVPVAMAVAAALGWAAVGMPGWASEEQAEKKSSSAAATTTPPVACDQQDSSNKGWYQPVYVHRAGKDPAAGVKSVRHIMWSADQIFEASAKRFGQGDSRRLRFVQDKDCQIDVMSVAVDGLPGRPSFPQARMKAEAAVAAEIRKAPAAVKKRFKRTRPVYFFDTKPRGCGAATTPKARLRSSMFRGRAAVSWGCATVPAVTHEMVHQFGVSHCDNKRDQGGDPICRGYDRTPRCGDLMANVFLDCAKDEFSYFRPRPESGSMLAERPGYNIANSPYLIKDQPAPALEMRLAGKRGGLCLGRGEGDSVVQQDCGSGDKQVWSRAIGKDGYLTVALKGTDKCLTAPSGKSATVLTTCAAGDKRQQWWMPSGRGNGADVYQLVNHETRKPLRIDGKGEGASVAPSGRGPAAGFRMLLTK